MTTTNTGRITITIETERAIIDALAAAAKKTPLYADCVEAAMAATREPLATVSTVARYWQSAWMP